MYLVDTNIWLEPILKQEKAEESERFLKGVDASSLAISEFSIYSIGVILIKLKDEALFQDFLNDLFEKNNVGRKYLSIQQLMVLPKLRQKFNLDFDDSYQYMVAESEGLTIVSFDSDFDKTDLGRKTPEQILNESAF